MLEGIVNGTFEEVIPPNQRAREVALSYCGPCR
jgi:hypothetical protein